MWEIWANELLPKVLKVAQKSKKLPNLVTLNSDTVKNFVFEISDFSFNFCLDRLLLHEVVLYL